MTEQDTAPSDLELLRQAREGRWEAFETLVGRLEPRVFGLARRILQQRQDAEDATQLTFLSVMENLDQFREEARVATWVLRIATNQALSILRKRQAARKAGLHPPKGGDSDDPPERPEFIAHWQDNPADLAHRAEVRELLDEALLELDEKYRLVFLLRDVEQFSTREAAELLGISVSNVKVRLLRARLQLRERLTRVLGDESTRLESSSHRHDA